MSLLVSPPVLVCDLSSASLLTTYVSGGTQSGLLGASSVQAIFVAAGATQSSLTSYTYKIQAAMGPSTLVNNAHFNEAWVDIYTYSQADGTVAIEHSLTKAALANDILQLTSLRGCGEFRFLVKAIGHVGATTADFVQAYAVGA
jgi:hypothetical protein